MVHGGWEQEIRNKNRKIRNEKVERFLVCSLKSMGLLEKLRCTNKLPPKFPL
jgi:hypothetical protein